MSSGSGTMKRSFSRSLTLTRKEPLRSIQSSPADDLDHLGEAATCLITGGNQGLGLQVAKALAAAGCKVIISSRSLKAGEKAAVEIATSAKVPQAKVVVHQMDLGDLHSVAAFVKAVQEEQLDIVICNAGVMCPPYTLTRHGFESTIGINHHGHFYLMQLLTPKLKSQAFKSRLVMVTSAKYLGSKGLNLSDLHYKSDSKNYRAAKAYDDSKLACILLAKEYDRRHSNTTAVAVDPGRCTSTKLTRYLGMSASLSSMAYRTVSKSPQEAASSIVYAAVSRDLATGAGGSYIEDCKIQATNSLADDKELAARLWDVTEREIQQAILE